MKKFWKFVNNDNGVFVSTGCMASGKKIKYSINETVEVDDYDEDSDIQCGRGIHCLPWNTNMYFNADHMAFGNHIIELEVAEKDIIFWNENDKCRVSKCNVVDEVNPVYDWMITGGMNPEWWSWVLYKGLACHTRIEIIDLWLKNNGDIHIRNEAPLLISAQNGDLEAMEFLIENGADLDRVRGDIEKTAYKNNYELIIDFLKNN
jgi:hypothetical protein